MRSSDKTCLGSLGGHCRAAHRLGTRHDSPGADDECALDGQRKQHKGPPRAPASGGERGAAGEQPVQFTCGLRMAIPHAPTHKYARSVWSRVLLPDAEGPRSNHSPLNSSAAGADNPPGPCCGKKFLNRRDHANHGRRAPAIFIRHALCAAARVLRRSALISFAPPACGSPLFPTVHHRGPLDACDCFGT